MPRPQRKSPRLKDYDYSLSGGYFVTICTHEKQHLFGSIRDGEMLLNDIGQIANTHWLKTPDYYPIVKLGQYVVMPNHVHMIVYLTETHDKAPTLGTIIGTYKAGVTRIVRRTFGSDTNSKRVVPQKIWQSSYHDHIIRNEPDLNRIQAYVQTNPARWESDTFYDS